jgi:uncharacterized protein YjbI with pentapeptide repeats
MTDEDRARFEVTARVVDAGHQAPFRRVDTDLHDQRLAVDSDMDVLVEGARLERVDLSGIRFWHLRASEAVFVDCDLSRISSRTGGSLGYFPGATYLNCRFDGADLRRILPGIGRFERCKFTNVRIRDWTADDASFVDCVFTGRIERSMFYGRRIFKYPDEHSLPPPNEFRGNDFTKADLIDVSFRGGADLSQQRMPQGPQFLVLDRWPERVDRARRSIARWQPGSTQREALNVLDIYWNGDEYQQWGWIRRDDLGKHTALDVLEQLHAELERPFATALG